jgi:hypothetical protein
LNKDQLKVAISEAIATITKRFLLTGLDKSVEFTLDSLDPVRVVRVGSNLNPEVMLEASDGSITELDKLDYYSLHYMSKVVVFVEQSDSDLYSFDPNVCW